MKADAWLVRAVYVVLEDAVSTDEIDQRVHGLVLHHGLGATWSLAGQAERAQLEWELPTFAEARTAVTTLRGIRGIERPHLGPTDENREAHPAAYDVTRAQVHAGRVRCPACGERIPEGADSFFSVQGVKDGDEFVLTCPGCGLAMSWRLVADAPMR
jgi:predicted RNA-binding Zn-ribbon protein involved in translation (DUF1610 family)